jgi:hypothetical protein
MKIKITEFAERHFDKDFGGTKILNMTKEEVEDYINNYLTFDDDLGHGNLDKKTGKIYNYTKAIDGYASFCKLVPIRNFTNARVGSMPITLENYQYLRSGYSARRESELPVFSRWLELPLGKPKAEYLMFVLYSKEQIDKEAKADYEKEMKRIEKSDHFEDEPELKLFDADWGVVAILGQSHPNEEPMKPETMLRNALGKEEGGSGVPLDRDAYKRSVEFWEKNATVK